MWETACEQQQINKLATFNTYDYDFLVKCLAEGSTIFKVESLKRFFTLAGADKKQFVNHLRAILSEMQGVYREDKEEINYHSITLLNEIVLNIQTKELSTLLFTRHLPLVLPALGHHTKTALRKAAHTVLLNSLKTYPQFSTLADIYLNYGFLSENQLVQQKSINSFQSILILELKHFDWADPRSLRLIETLVSKIEAENLFVSKAASQCVLSICKMEGMKEIVGQLSKDCIRKLKNFMEQITLKMPTDAFLVTPLDLAALLDSSKVEKQPVRYQPESSPPQQQPEQMEYKKESLKNTVNQRRLQKIKKSIKAEEKKEKEVHGAKLFSFLTGEGTLKERTEAMEDLLFKIQVNKNKPEFESSIKAVFPTLLKMLKDNNPKIVSLTLRILQNCIEWVAGSENQLTNLVSVIVQKLGDQKISIRQNVSKVIRDLANKTNKNLWIHELMDNLKKNTSTILKDQTLYLIHHIYENCTKEEVVDVPTSDIIEQISLYTDDPKTKIKIRTLDCLSVIVFRSAEIQKYNAELKSKMSSVFYQMYLEKLGKLQEEAQRKEKDVETEKKKREPNQYAPTETYRTIQRDRNDARSEGGDKDEDHLNVSMETVKRRVSLLRKPRNLLSTQETISVDHSTHRVGDKSMEEVEIMLPSLYKKTGNKFIPSKKTDFAPNKTIEGKPSDYLSKDDLKPLRDPQKQMRMILIDLKSNDWKTQFETTNKLRRLIEYHPEVILAQLPANIHALVLDMVAMVENLRSSVSKNSLICINEFIVLMGKQIDNEMDIVLEKLIKKSADTNVFISSEVQKCLNTLCVNSTPSKVLEKLAAYRESKSTSVKEAIVNTLLCMKDSEKVREKQHCKLAESIGFYLMDGQLQVRSKAKQGIVELSKQLGDWYRALRGKINPIYFKSICELMTKSPSRRQDYATLSPAKNTFRHESISSISNDYSSAKNEQRQERAERAEPPPSKKKPPKVAQFPAEFNDIQSILEGSNSSDWKKRIEAVTKIKQIALQYPNEFSQYRSATYFMDVVCKQISEPNIKVSLNGMSMLLEIYEPLKLLVENNLGIICNSVFTGLSSSKAEIRQNAEKCVAALLQGTEIQSLLQFLCHGIVYALPRSRIYLLNQLTEQLQYIFQEKKQLLFKNVFPLLNKLMEEYKAELMPHVVVLFDRLYDIMGNQMFSHLAKFKEVRELINK